MRQIVECAPNFSEGRREEIIRALVESITASGVQVLDVQADADQNRCVVRFVGDLAAVERAAFHAAEQAAELIDMGKHSGDHPRIGAIDVIPFVPVAGVALGDCVALARRVGERLGRELQLPVFLYGEAATRPERFELKAVRDVGYEGLRDRADREPDLAPDFGPSAVGSAGAAAVGARHPLVALNVYLDTERLDVADAVARAAREESGGLKHVRAEGSEDRHSGLAKLSVTLSRPDQTPLPRVIELIRAEASRFGVALLSTELVGVVPQSVLLAAAEWYLQLETLAPEQVLESRLVDLLAEGGQPTRPPLEFLDAVASETPTPGGGGAAALAGALAAALSRMVANLTLANEADDLPEQELRGLRDQAMDLQQGMLGLIDGEASAFEALSAAHQMPSGNPEETAARRAAIQSALIGATEVQLSILRAAREILRLVKIAADLGAAETLADAGVARHLAEAAAKGAGLGIEVNVRGVRDLQEGDRYRQAANDLLREVVDLATEVDRLVSSRVAA